MQFNSSLNKQESILALTQATKEQKVQELSLSVTRMSPDGVFVQEGDWEKEREKRLLRTISTKVSHLVSFGFLSGLVPTPLARYKSNWSTPFRYFEHSCNGWAWARWNRKKVEEEDKKVWKAHINEDNHRQESHMIDMMWGVGIAMQHADAHRAISVWKPCNGTSGGASNLLAHEDLEIFWGGSSLEYASQVL